MSLIVAISCKLGAVDKQQIGLKQEQKINISANHESMNNPIAQALVLNDTKTDFNIMLCLCVGHNSIFLMYIEGLPRFLQQRTESPATILWPLFTREILNIRSTKTWSTGLTRNLNLSWWQSEVRRE